MENKTQLDCLSEAQLNRRIFTFLFKQFNEPIEYNQILLPDITYSNGPFSLFVDKIEQSIINNIVRER